MAVIILSMFACRNNANSEAQETCSFDIYFIQKGTTTPITMGCINELKNVTKENDIFFKTINAQDFTAKFSRLVRKLTKSKEENYPNIRITVYAKYSNKKVDTICFGENNGILLNGQIMNDSRELLHLIKTNIGFETAYRVLD